MSALFLGLDLAGRFRGLKYRMRVSEARAEASDAPSLTRAVGDPLCYPLSPVDHASNDDFRLAAACRAQGGVELAVLSTIQSMSVYEPF